MMLGERIRLPKEADKCKVSPYMHAMSSEGQVGAKGYIILFNPGARWSQCCFITDGTSWIQESSEMYPVVYTQKRGRA